MKKQFLILLLLASSYSAFSQDLYDINTIQDIRIVFAQSNWDALLDAQASSTEDYIWIARQYEDKMKPGAVFGGWLVFAGLARAFIELCECLCKRDINRVVC